MEPERPITTAAAITPPGEGGIAVIVLSGPDTLAILKAVFIGARRPAQEIGDGALAYGTIRRDGQVLDEVIVARVDEDDDARFEINCHGGVVAVNAVLKCLKEAGARVIPWQSLQPGRAPKDPLSAEAIRAAALDALPSATTRLGATMLLHQAGGALNRAVEALAAQPGPESILRLRATWCLGRALLNPPRVAIVGPPNTGKSTLLNALLEEERVIVHHEPGTTRDVVRETVSICGMPFELMDTAGIRETEDEVERHAVGLAARMAAGADIVLTVYDVSEVSSVPIDLPGSTARIIRVANKIDLLEGTVASMSSSVAISAHEHRNLSALEDALLEPYRKHLNACRKGAPIVFTIEQAVALDDMLDAGCESLG